jgi:hypothetical protein
MIRKLVEALERAQIEAQELQHDVREEKKKNKDFQSLLEEMVTYVRLLIAGPKNKTTKGGTRQRTSGSKGSSGTSQQSRSV